jgi:hypothetical protein
MSIFDNIQNKLYCFATKLFPEDGRHGPKHVGEVLQKTVIHIFAVSWYSYCIVNKLHVTCLTLRWF